MTIDIENSYAKYVIQSDGRNLHFVDKSTGIDYCVQNPRSSFARVKKTGGYYDASSVSYTDGQIEVQFGESGVTGVIRVVPMTATSSWKLCPWETSMWRSWCSPTSDSRLEECRKNPSPPVHLP